jgi:hypothetical protein
MIGIMYSSLIHAQDGYPWVVNAQATSPLLEGTGLQPGQQYGCGLVGYEWDRIFDNGATPRGLQVLGASPTISEYHRADMGDTTYYRAASGALVFATGSIYWTRALDSYRYQPDPHCPQPQGEIPAIQNLMRRIMVALVQPQWMQQA